MSGTYTPPRDGIRDLWAAVISQALADSTQQISTAHGTSATRPKRYERHDAITFLTATEGPLAERRELAAAGAGIDPDVLVERVTRAMRDGVCLMSQRVPAPLAAKVDTFEVRAARVIAMLQEGKKRPEIASALGTTVKAVDMLTARLRRKGRLPAGRRGRPTHPSNSVGTDRRASVEQDGGGRANALRPVSCELSEHVVVHGRIIHGDDQCLQRSNIRDFTS